MRVKVDVQLCSGHGFCQEEAPEVFRVREVEGVGDRVELITDAPDESLREQVQAARRYCPNRVISIAEGD